MYMILSGNVVNNRVSLMDSTTTIMTNLDLMVHTKVHLEALVVQHIVDIVDLRKCKDSEADCQWDW